MHFLWVNIQNDDYSLNTLALVVLDDSQKRSSCEGGRARMIDPIAQMALKNFREVRADSGDVPFIFQSRNEAYGE